MQGSLPVGLRGPYAENQTQLAVCKALTPVLFIQKILLSLFGYFCLFVLGLYPAAPRGYS